jgi:hypothetical protein
MLHTVKPCKGIVLRGLATQRKCEALFRIAMRRYCIVQYSYVLQWLGEALSSMAKQKQCIVKRCVTKDQHS